MTQAIVVAGTHSGVGKTSVSLGIMRAFKRRGLKVQPFKVGPDYLDPIWHRQASGTTSYNLDAWMTSPEYVQKLFASKTAGADVAIIEGVMGLFDGASPTTLAGSTAEIGCLLDVPVLLVATAQGTSRSFAATIQGFAEFEKGCHVSHVIANHCGSKRHAEILDESLAGANLPQLTGHLLRDSLPTLPSRHLGLSTPTDQADADQICDQLADIVEQGCDLDSFIDTGMKNQPSVATDESLWESPINIQPKTASLGVAIDEAFFFYYPDNLELLESLGIQIVPFSPIHDPALPNGLSGLYLGGGYPERFTEQLSANGPMLDQIQTFAQSGKPVYAECGGMMYLSKSITSLEGNVAPMANVLPFATQMLARKKRLGYTQSSLLHPTILGSPATGMIRGHEFHYSEMVEEIEIPDWDDAYGVTNARGERSRTAGITRGNILASYVHHHFQSNPAFAVAFAQSLSRH